MTKINTKQSSDASKSAPQDGGNASAVKKKKTKEKTRRRNRTLLCLPRTKLYPEHLKGTQLQMLTC